MPTFALNFYNPAVAEQLRTGRKTATIRLGDKSAKYRKGMIVTVLCGARYGQRERIFDAVIDKVEVKALSELSPREIEHDNPQIRRVEEMVWFLSQLYNREVAEEDIVTVIRFSQITQSPPHTADRRPEELGLADWSAAFLALHRERRCDRRLAARAAMSEIAPALRAPGRQRGLAVEEVPQRVTACK